MAQWTKDQSQGCVPFGALIVLGASGWLAYSLLYAPSARDETPTASEATISADERVRLQQRVRGEASVRSVLIESFREAEPRLEFMEGGNLNIYVSRVDFEGIADPDREPVIKRIGEAWCGNVDKLFVPSVRIRDIRTGQELATFGCVTGNVSLAH